MTWVTPKTTWSSNEGEAFNIDPDYLRIKGNIEYLHTISEEMYHTFSIIELETATMYPKASFYNNIVSNINTIRNNTFEPIGYVYMRSYVSEGVIWNNGELNVIENNIKLLYQIVQYQKNILPVLSFALGGDGF